MFHARFDRLNETPATLLERCFGQTRLLNTLQPREIRLERTARDWLRRARANARP